MGDDLELDLARATAYLQGIPLEQLLSERAAIEAKRDQQPEIEDRNGAMFQDGNPMTADQIKLYDAGNPNNPENWLAGDRALTPEQQSEDEKFQEGIRQREAARRDAAIRDGKAEEAAFLKTLSPGVPMPTNTPQDWTQGPIIRGSGTPVRGIKVEKTSVEAIPVKIAAHYNSAAAAKPPLKNVFRDGGPTSRTGKPRKAL